MSDELVLPLPNLKLPEYVFHLSNPKLAHLHDEARTKLLAGIEADQMAPFYKVVSSGPSPLLPLDQELLTKMEEANKAELETLTKRLEEAEKTEGETEVSDILRARATYLTRIGDFEKAIEAQKIAVEKTPGVGSKIDGTLTLARIGFFSLDNDLIRASLADAEKLIEQGGDWDRRNRLKVYNGLQAISIREFKQAGVLFTDALSTFTASELIEYEDFVALAVITNMVSLGRVDLKAKVVKNPEVNAVLPSHPSLATFTSSFHNCKYDEFIRALADVEQQYLLPSRILSPHARWYIREMKIRGYAQLLESYRSVTLNNMSQAFGLPAAFIDSDLSKFIAAGRIHASIDKVQGIIVTTRPEIKTAQYETLIKQGDILLNKVQRLSKVLY